MILKRICFSKDQFKGRSLQEEQAADTRIEGLYKQLNKADEKGDSVKVATLTAKLEKEGFIPHRQALAIREDRKKITPAGVGVGAVAGAGLGYSLTGSKKAAAAGAAIGAIGSLPVTAIASSIRGSKKYDRLRKEELRKK